MVGPVEYVKEAKPDELACGLEPPRIEMHQARIAEKLKGSHRAARWQKTKSDDNAPA